MADKDNPLYPLRRMLENTPLIIPSKIRDVYDLGPKYDNRYTIIVSAEDAATGISRASRALVTDEEALKPRWITVNAISSLGTKISYSELPIRVQMYLVEQRILPRGSDQIRPTIEDIRKIADNTRDTLNINYPEKNYAFRIFHTEFLKNLNAKFKE